MSTGFYRFWRQVIRIFTRPMKTEWEVPFEGGPCVFVANHLGATGPIAMCARFPLTASCHPWITAQVMDKKEIKDFVRLDQWWNHNSFLHPILNAVVPPLAALLIPPIMQGANGIPVYRDTRVMTTFRKSIAVLKSGENLLIFPENVSGHGEYDAELNTGWLMIADLWYKASGNALNIYPVLIDKKAHTIRVSAPVVWDTERTLNEQTDEVIKLISAGIGR